MLPNPDIIVVLNRQLILQLPDHLDTVVVLLRHGPDELVQTLYVESEPVDDGLVIVAVVQLTDVMTLVSLEQLLGSHLILHSDEVTTVLVVLFIDTHRTVSACRGSGLLSRARGVASVYLLDSLQLLRITLLQAIDEVVIQSVILPGLVEEVAAIRHYLADQLHLVFEPLVPHGLSTGFPADLLLQLFYVHPVGMATGLLSLVLLVDLVQSVLTLVQQGILLGELLFVLLHIQVQLFYLLLLPVILLPLSLHLLLSLLQLFLQLLHLHVHQRQLFQRLALLLLLLLNSRDFRLHLATQQFLLHSLQLPIETLYLLGVEVILLVVFHRSHQPPQLLVQLPHLLIHQEDELVLSTAEVHQLHDPLLVHTQTLPLLYGHGLVYYLLVGHLLLLLLLGIHLLQLTDLLFLVLYGAFHHCYLVRVALLHLHDGYAVLDVLLHVLVLGVGVEAEALLVGEELVEVALGETVLLGVEGAAAEVVAQGFHLGLFFPQVLVEALSQQFHLAEYPLGLALVQPHR